MRTVWIVVADAGRARVLSKLDGTEGLTAVRQLENPPGRAHTIDMVSDRLGRFQKHGSNTRSAMGPPADRHEQRAREFAGRLAHLLNAAALRREFDELALVAPAHFLHLLGGGLKPAAQRRLALYQANDLTRLSNAEVESRLDDALCLPDGATASAR